MTPAKVVAEIGCVHLGDMNRARKLIRLAALAGADYAKFQKRNPIECVPKHLHDKPHPNQIFSYGKTYLEHRQNLEFTVDQHEELMDYCLQVGIGYSTSVWDLTSAREIIPLEPHMLKIGSPSNNNFELIDCLIDEYDGDIHISTGMSTEQEVDHLIEYLFVKREVDPQSVVLYHCVSEYPCSFDHLYLLEVDRLKKIVPDGVRVGFSNHGYGIAADIAAFMLGAEWIERHFVDDRTLRHTDAAASLEPDGLRRLCRDLQAVTKTLKLKPGLTEEEMVQRDKLKPSD
jgi:N-acetylneuraminate synthase